MRRITLQVKKKTHVLLKLLAVCEGKHLNEITEQALEEFIARHADALKELLENNKNRLSIAVVAAVLSHWPGLPNSLQPGLQPGPTTHSAVTATGRD